MVCQGGKSCAKAWSDESFCGHFCPRRKAANFCHPVLKTSCWRSWSCSCHPYTWLQPTNCQPIGAWNSPFAYICWIMLFQFSFKRKNLRTQIFLTTVNVTSWNGPRDRGRSKSPDIKSFSFIMPILDCLLQCFNKILLIVFLYLKCDGKTFEVVLNYHCSCFLCPKVCVKL